MRIVGGGVTGGGKGSFSAGRVDERVDASRRSWAAFSNSCETSSSLDFALGCESSTLACREVFMNVWVELATKNANVCSISIKKSKQNTLSNDILVHNLLPSHSVCLQVQNCVYLARKHKMQKPFQEFQIRGIYHQRWHAHCSSSSAWCGHSVF